MFQKTVFALFLIFFSVSPALADFAAGKKAYDAQDWRKAILNLRPLAEAGEDRAMLLLGNMYLQGLGVLKDPAEAFILYRSAAILGNPDGMLATATLYQTGEGVAMNKPVALEWYGRAARTGHQTAAFLYAAHLYQGSKGEGYDLKPDLTAAYKWFRIAARGNINTPLRSAAERLADNLAPKVPLIDKRRIDQETPEWKPLTGEALGPVPDADLKPGQLPLIKVPDAGAATP